MTRKVPAIAVAAMLVLTVFASIPVAAAESVTVETETPTNVTADSATLNGEVTELDNASEATVWFEYWIQGDETNSTSSATLAVTGNESFSIGVPDLQPNTTYVVVAHAETENASAVGSDVTFTTDPETALAVSTGEATDVTSDSATLAGELTTLAGLDNASVRFVWWEKGDPVNHSSTTNQTLDSPGTFTASVTGLANNTTYAFVAQAVGGNLSEMGDTSEFTTLDRSAALGVDTLEASAVDNTSATLNGQLTGLDGEDEATVWFEYWIEGDASNATETPKHTLDDVGSFSAGVSGLDNDTTYVYVAHAAANNTSVAGDEVEFTTGADGDRATNRTWDGEGPFGLWLTSVLKNLMPADDVPFGQLVSDIVTANNPGSEHRSDRANPGGNGSGPPDHAGPPDADNRTDDDEGENGPPDHAGPPDSDDNESDEGETEDEGDDEEDESDEQADGDGDDREEEDGDDEEDEGDDDDDEGGPPDNPGQGNGQ